MGICLSQCRRYLFTLCQELTQEGTEVVSKRNVTVMRQKLSRASRTKRALQNEWTRSLNQLKGVLKFYGLMGVLFLALALSRELFLGITRGPDVGSFEKLLAGAMFVLPLAAAGCFILMPSVRERFFKSIKLHLRTLRRK